MEILNFIIENWYVIAGIFAIGGMGVYSVFTFFKMPNTKQKAKIIEWLLIACDFAEKELGSKTGEKKLKMVYDMFVKTFPIAAFFMSFEAFSILVDEALDKIEKALIEE